MSLSGRYRSKKTGKTERYQSSYELRRMKYLDAHPNVKTWTKNHKIRIRYKEGKKRRRYIPDFLVELNDGKKFLEEVKGYVWNRLNFARKNLAANMWCNYRGITFRIIREEDLEVLL